MAPPLSSPWDKGAAQCPPCRCSATSGPPQEGRTWLCTGVLASGCRTRTKCRAPWGPVSDLHPSPPCWGTRFWHRSPSGTRKTCCCWWCWASSPPGGTQLPAPLNEHMGDILISMGVQELNWIYFSFDSKTISERLIVKKKNFKTKAVKQTSYESFTHHPGNDYSGLPSWF